MAFCTFIDDTALRIGYNGEKQDNDDKLSGIITGLGEPQKSPNNLAQNQPPSKANLDLWWSYFLTEFAIRDQDVAMILPALGSGLTYLISLSPLILLQGDEGRYLI